MGGNTGSCVCVFTKHARFGVKRLGWVKKVVEVGGGNDGVVLVLGIPSISLIFPALVLCPKKDLTCI